MGIQTDEKKTGRKMNDGPIRKVCKLGRLD